MVFEKGKLYKNKLGEELLYFYESFDFPGSAHYPYIFKNLNRNVQKSFTKEGFFDRFSPHSPRDIIMNNQEITPAEAPHPFLPFIENAWYKTREGKRVQFKFSIGDYNTYSNIFLNEENILTFTKEGIYDKDVFGGPGDIVALVEMPLNKCTIKPLELMFLTSVLNGFLQRMKEANVDEESINRAGNM